VTAGERGLEAGLERGRQTGHEALERGHPTRIDVVLTLIEVLLAGACVGTTLLTGAVVAAVVFRHVDAPQSGDAMALIFARTHRAQLLAYLLVLVFEGVLSWRARARLPRAAQRYAGPLLGAVVVSTAMAMLFWLTPAIAALHEAGAVRGVGELGRELDRLHTVSVRVGLVQMFAALVLAWRAVARLARAERKDL
jgi:hypothetical protein